MNRVLIAVICTVLVGCSSSQQGRKSPAQAIEIIGRYPSWRDLKPSDGTTEVGVVSCLHELRSLEPKTVRCAFVQLRAMGSGYDLETAFKLRAINRYVFNVPEWVDDKVSASPFGGWVGIPREHGRVNELWPLKWGDDGQLQLAGSNVGYMGPDFDAVGEFDYFKSRYGFRGQMR